MTAECEELAFHSPDNGSAFIFISISMKTPGLMEARISQRSALELLVQRDGTVDGFVWMV